MSDVDSLGRPETSGPTNCFYCGFTVPQADCVPDHKVPYQLAGLSGPRDPVAACRDCHDRVSRSSYSRIPADLIWTTAWHRRVFLDALAGILDLAQISIEDARLQRIHRRLLHAQAITAMECYLSDTLAGAIAADRSILRPLIENAPDLRQRKLTLAEIHSRYLSLEDEALTYLREQLYHNLHKASILYHAALGFKLQPPPALLEAVRIRHDLVHRGGRDDAGREIVLSDHAIRDLLQELETFILRVHHAIHAAERRRFRPEGVPPGGSPAS